MKPSRECSSYEDVHGIGFRDGFVAGVVCSVLLVFAVAGAVGIAMDVFAIYAARAEVE